MCSKYIPYIFALSTLKNSFHDIFEPRVAPLKKIFVESCGVKIEIASNVISAFADIKNRLSKTLPNGFRSIDSGAQEHSFFITVKNSVFQLWKNDELIADSTTLEVILEILERHIRIAVAEFALGKVFLHAGVVAIDGKAIVMPAQSFQGKTTLVAEMVKKGAIYYSDEYAILDESGFVHPFPKKLSMRGIMNDYVQTDLSIEELGGVAGVKPIPVALVLITQYDKNAQWKPKTLSNGQGILEILPHAFPIRNKPEFTLSVLNKLAERSIITKTKRAEAEGTARLLVSFFEKQVLGSNSIHNKKMNLGGEND